MLKKQEEILKKLIKLNGWSKSGGHPKKLQEIYKLLEDAKCKKIKLSQKHQADGSFSKSNSTYKHPIGLYFEVGAFYGQTKSGNSFSFRIVNKPF